MTVPAENTTIPCFAAAGKVGAPKPHLHPLGANTSHLLGQGSMLWVAQKAGRYQPFCIGNV